MKNALQNKPFHIQIQLFYNYIQTLANQIHPFSNRFNLLQSYYVKFLCITHYFTDKWLRIGFGGISIERGELYW